MAALFGVLTLTLRANQVASGLALTMFGLGLSALWGQGYSGLSAPAFPAPLRAGPHRSAVRRQAAVRPGRAALSLLRHGGCWSPGCCERTRLGLIVRAIGENHDAAHAIGYPVIAYRYLAVMFGGAMAGLGGAYLSLVQTPLWVERMTAGRGWIALALVVFAAWRPWRVLLGAYLFGGITILQLHSQALGVKIDAQLLVDAALPRHHRRAGDHLARHHANAKLTAPACLGKPFHAAA